MRDQLIAARLWDEKDARNPSADLTCAWKVLARLGAPYRFGGRGLNGQIEYLVLSPASGEVIACGRGADSAQAMCQAALSACRAASPMRMATGH